jgi:hypothetical protein
MDEAIALSSQVAAAYDQHLPHLVEELMVQTESVGRKTKHLANSKAAGGPIMSPADLRMLNDTQRLNLLSSVASGNRTMDEALTSAQQEVHHANTAK